MTDNQPPSTAPETTTELNDPQTYAIIGAAIEVHKVLGGGFLEQVYQEALACELAERAIPFTRESILPVTYKGSTLACGFRADFICFGEVILELKSIEKLTPVHEAQVLNYLKATGLERALLFNFGPKSLETKRYVRSRHWG